MLNLGLSLKSIPAPKEAPAKGTAESFRCSSLYVIFVAPKPVPMEFAVLSGKISREFLALFKKTSARSRLPDTKGEIRFSGERKLYFRPVLKVLRLKPKLVFEE